MSIANFDFHNFMPGQSLPGVPEIAVKGSIIWGQDWHQVFYPAVIDGASRDAGNTGYTATLRPGLLLGKAYGVTGKWKQWDPTATDGTQRIQGVLLKAQVMTNMGTDYDRFQGIILVRGNVRASGLSIASTSTQGIVGSTLEWLVRDQMKHSFIFDDMPAGYHLGVNKVDISAASLTVTEAMAGTMFIATGATAKNFTLPATPKRGLAYQFYNSGNGNLTITAGTPDTLIILNDDAADSVSLSTAGELIGNSFTVIGNGTKWMVIPALWEANTVTPVT